MADRVYPSSKPNPQPPNGAATAKSQPYGAGRPAYRPRPPPPKPRRRRRGCCCVCCLWLTLLLLALVLLAAIAAGAFYVLYRPHRPSFSVSSLRLSALNVTGAGAFSARLNLAVAARNPNSKLAFLYGPTSISATSNGVPIAAGSFPAFEHEPKNTTVLRAVLSSSGESVGTDAAADLRRSRIPLEIQLDTDAGIKIGSFKSKHIGISVNCIGISVTPPKTKPTASPTDASCTVKLRVKIWKWTV